MTRKLLLTLLLALAPFYSVADEGCITSPTTTCLLQLIGEDIHTISDEDDGELWRSRYAEMLHRDILREFYVTGLDAVRPRLLAMEHSPTRDSAIQSIAMKLASDGDKRVLELVWESGDDHARLEAMLAASTNALEASRRELAWQLFDDARFLFSRIISESPDRRLLRKIQKVARTFNDEQLLESLSYEYKSAVIATSTNERELREAGAYRQGLQSALRKRPGGERLNAVLALSRDWMKGWGAESLQNEVLQDHHALFKAASMYTLGNHVLRVDKDPDKALEYIDRAESYADGISSSEEREGVYKEIAEIYQEIARKYETDISAKAIALGEKVKDPETVLYLQMTIIVGPMDRKEYEQARLLAEREQRPLIWVIYHYFMAEQAKETGDSSALLEHVQQAARYVAMLDEPVELRSEVLMELGKVLRKAEYNADARALLLQAVDAAAVLQGKKRYQALENIAGELRKLGDEIEADRVLRMAHQAIEQITEPQQRAKLLLELGDMDGSMVLQDKLQADYLALESRLKGEDLADYYFVRAEQSGKREQLETALNFVNQALQQPLTEKRLKELLRRGSKLFSTRARLPYLISMLQHPMLPREDREEAIISQLEEVGDKVDNIEELIPLVELLDDEGQVSALVELLRRVHQKGRSREGGDILQRLQKMIRRQPALGKELIESMLGQRNQSLLEHYRDELGTHIAALKTVSQKYYFNALLHYRSGLVGEEAQAVVATQLEELLALENRTERARTILVYVMAVEGYEERTKKRKRRR